MMPTKKHGESETSEPESPSTVAPLPLDESQRISSRTFKIGLCNFSQKTKPKNTTEKLDTTKVEKTTEPVNLSVANLECWKNCG